MPKEHRDDAICIANDLGARKIGKLHEIRCIAQHGRVPHVQKPRKGGERRSASAPYWLGGTRFTRYDTVLFNGQKCFTSGSSNGYPMPKDMNWGKVEGRKTTITPRKLRITHRHGSMLVAWG